MMMVHSKRWSMHAVSVAVMLLSSGCISTQQTARPQQASVPGAAATTPGNKHDVTSPGNAALAQSLYEAARDQIALQQWVLAMQGLDKALTVDPSHVESLNARASLRAQFGDLSGALTDLQAAIGIDPSRAHLHFNLGLVHQLRADQPAARQAFERTLNLKPSHERARLALASGAVTAQAVAPQAPSPLVNPGRTGTLAAGASQPGNAPVADVSVAPTHDSLIKVTSADEASKSKDPDRVRVENQPTAQSPARSDIVVVQTSPARQARTDAQDSSTESDRVEVRIAIANGNGVAGLARALKAQLAEVGPYLTTTRNWVNFEQRETRVFHRPGFELVANKVSQALPVEAPTAVLSPAAMGGRDVLVVLGQDIKSLSGARNKGAESLATLPAAVPALVSSRSVQKESTDVSKL
jgi:tetratricopeptide (TPR) repeat protein